MHFFRTKSSDIETKRKINAKLSSEETKSFSRKTQRCKEPLQTRGSALRLCVFA